MTGGTQVNRIREQLARVGDRTFDRLRHRDAFAVTDGEVGASFDPLRGHRYVLLVTFRRDGRPVPSPVWLAVGPDGLAYVKTSTQAAKVRRIRNNPSVIVAPCTMRGRPTGPAIRGSASLLAQEDSALAEQTLASRYSLDRKLAEKMLGDTSASVYIAIAPHMEEPER
jgi:PPOX class probable F420-dependent enzyme